MKACSLDINASTATITYSLLEDNSSILEIATTYKFRLRIKYINVKLYYFCDFISRDNIIIKPIKTLHQLANYLTKQLASRILVLLYKKVMG